MRIRIKSVQRDLPGHQIGAIAPKQAKGDKIQMKENLSNKHLVETDHFGKRIIYIYMFMLSSDSVFAISIDFGRISFLFLSR